MCGVGVRSGREGKDGECEGSKEGWRRELRLADGAIGWWYGIEIMDGWLMGCC